MKEEKNELLLPDLLVKDDVITALGEPEKLEVLVSTLEEAAKSIVIDPGTEKGRDEIKSLAYKVARTKTALDEIGKDYVGDLKAKIKPLDAARKIVRDRLDALRDLIRKPVNDFEAAEAERKQKHESAITIMSQMAIVEVGTDLESIENRIESVTAIDPKNMEEFSGRATEVKLDCIEKLNAAKQVEIDRIEQAKIVQKAKDDAAELEALRAQKVKDDAEKAKADNPPPAEPVAATDPAPVEQTQMFGSGGIPESTMYQAPAETTGGEKASIDQKKEWKASWHRAAAMAIQDAGGTGEDGANLISDDAAKEIVKAIVKGEVPRVNFDYSGLE